MKKTLILVGFLVLMFIPYVNARAETLSCDGGIVSTDDSRVDLVMKCGEPDWKDSHNEEITEWIDSGTKNKVIVTIDEWTYNFGSSQLIRTVTMRNGRITDVRTGNYGDDKSSGPD